MAHYAPAPQSSPSSTEQRFWGTLSHAAAGAGMVLSAGTLGFVAALIVWFVYKDRGGLARNAAANSLNIQLNALLWLIVSAVLFLVLIGFITYPLVIVWAIVMHVIGAVKANAGSFWKPPFVIRFFS